MCSERFLHWSQHGCMTAIYSTLTSQRNSPTPAAQRHFFIQLTDMDPCFRFSVPFLFKKNIYIPQGTQWKKIHFKDQYVKYTVSVLALICHAAFVLMLRMLIIFLERLFGLFCFTSFFYMSQLSVMKSGPCQVKRFCCFFGANNGIDLTFSFLAVR